MKIAMVCESLAIPSGFGEQSRMLAEGFVTKGHEVIVISRGRRKEQFSGIREIGLADMYNPTAIDNELHREKPDCAIFFWHLGGISMMCKCRSVTANVPTFIWLPFEGSTLSPGFEMQFTGVPKNTVVHLSEFSRKLWGDRFSEGPVIPHCYDEEIWKLPEINIKELRRKWSKKLRFPVYDDSLVILNLDRNITHKRWDLTMDYIRRLSQEYKEVVLIAHTKKVPDGMGDTTIDRTSGYQMEELAKAYGVSDNVVFTDFDWHTPFSRQELIELYALCDFRISTSAGEGFGVPTLEAAVLGVKQIVNGCTTIPEILGEYYPGVIPPASSYLDRGCLWQSADVRRMVDETLYQFDTTMDNYYNPSMDVEKTKLSVETKFSKKTVLDQWEKLLVESVDNTKYATYHRQGWFGAAMYKNNLRALALLIKNWFPRQRVLELGVYDGYLCELLAELGIDFVGIEPDNITFDKLPDRIKSHVIQTDFYNPFPPADIVVCSDVFELVQNYGDIVQFVQQLNQYPWVFIRFENTYRWDYKLADLKYIRALLLSNGMVPRHELTDSGEREQKFLRHELWANSADSLLNIPRNITEKVGAGHNGEKT